MMGAGGQLSRRMMRRNGAHVALHERPAIARFAVPVIQQLIAGGECPRQVMLVEHRQTVAHAVDALKQDPAARPRRLERLAERLNVRGLHAVAEYKVGLNESVTAA